MAVVGVGVGMRRGGLPRMCVLCLPHVNRAAGRSTSHRDLPRVISPTQIERNSPPHCQSTPHAPQSGGALPPVPAPVTTILSRSSLVHPHSGGRWRPSRTSFLRLTNLDFQPPALVPPPFAVLPSFSRSNALSCYPVCADCVSFVCPYRKLSSPDHQCGQTLRAPSPAIL